MSNDVEGPGHASRCPRCGLALQVRMRGEGPELAYDFPAWSRQCRLPLLGGPSMCLARAFEATAGAVEPGADFLGNLIGRPLGYS